GQEIPRDAQPAAIVSAVISMGKSLKHRVIAEGVETPEQLAFLKREDCEEGQGYYFSVPLAAQDFARLLEPAPRSRIPLHATAARHGHGAQQESTTASRSPREIAG